MSGLVNPYKEDWSSGYCGNGITCTKGVIGKELLKAQQIISDFFKEKTSVDFEWCVINGFLVFVQLRPISRRIEINSAIKQTHNDLNKKEFYGIPASPGIVEGKSKFVGNLSKLDSWHEGDILMAWFTDPDWIDIMNKSSGLVTAVGGLLCHAAILSRELGKPYVVGIGQSMKSLWEEDYIRVDANVGLVSAIKNDVK